MSIIGVIRNIMQFLRNLSEFQLFRPNLNYLDIALKKVIILICQIICVKTSKMKHFSKINNGFQLLTIFGKRSI